MRDPYVQLLALLAALFFLPKILQRFRIPAPLTELGLGAALGPVGIGWLSPSDLLQGLSGFGITALFLFAGLEVDLGELNERRRTLLEHLLIQSILLVAATWVGLRLGLQTGPAVLVAAAIMSPSVGYIVAALEAREVRPDLEAWVKQKAIAAEILAILVVMVFANTASVGQLGFGLGVFAALIVGVPVLVLIFHKVILPFAPKTEFSFLLIVALIAAYVSHHVGMHFLAGAFLVGLVARRYLDWLSREPVEARGVREAFTAFRFFATFFVPFFFLQVGLNLPAGALRKESAIFAGALLLVAIPLRILPTLLHRRLGLREGWREATTVGLFLMPTTVLTLAVAEILRDRFQVDDTVFGGLVLYGAATTLVPLFVPGARMETGDEIIVLASGEVLKRKVE